MEFFRPKATGRSIRSARLLSMGTWGWSTKTVGVPAESGSGPVGAGAFQCLAVPSSAGPAVATRPRAYGPSRSMLVPDPSEPAGSTPDHRLPAGPRSNDKILAMRATQASAQGSRQVRCFPALMKSRRKCAQQKA